MPLKQHIASHANWTYPYTRESSFEGGRHILDISYLNRKVWLISIAVGVFFAIFTHVTGQKAVTQTKALSEKNLQIISHKIVESFLVSQKIQDYGTRQKQIKKALAPSLQHPQIESITVFNGPRQILAQVHRDYQRAYFKAKQLSYPILGPNGQFLGEVAFELNNKPNKDILDMQDNIFHLSLLAFTLGFFISFFLMRKSQPLTKEILETVKKVGAGNLDVRISETGQKEFKELASAINSMIDGLEERDRMRHSLGRIMDPKLAEALIKENPKLGGRRRKATILFCDIRNYTSICEQLDAEELQEFLNEYWKGTVEIIMEQEGTIDKFHGDGVCVIFGAPSLHEDDPLRAVRTAWRLVGNVAALNERRVAKRKMPIQIGIGIHTGEVIAGHIGSERRMDYTVVGDVVNVAARIEELNKKFGTQILISDKVYEKVEQFVRVKTLTLAHLRGHKRPILIHALKSFHDIKDNINRKAA